MTKHKVSSPAPIVKIFVISTFISKYSLPLRQSQVTQQGSRQFLTVTPVIVRSGNCLRSNQAKSIKRTLTDSSATLGTNIRVYHRNRLLNFQSGKRTHFNTTATTSTCKFIDFKHNNLTRENRVSYLRQTAPRD